MATTKKINNDGTAWITTFYGGIVKGRLYKLSCIQEEERAYATFTEAELFALLESKGFLTLDVSKPEFDG